MDSFTGSMLHKAMEDSNAFAKALAHFMFREIVEDIHAEGKITDAEMKQLNKEACNRASMLVNEIFPHSELCVAVMMEAVYALNWDPPELTEQLKKRLELYQALACDFEI